MHVLPISFGLVSFLPSRRAVLFGAASLTAGAGLGGAFWLRDPHGLGVDTEVLRTGGAPPGELPPLITPIDQHYVFHAHRTPAPQTAEEAELWISREEGDKTILTWAEALDGLPRTKIPATLACDGNGFPIGQVELPRYHRTWTRWGWRYGGIGTHVWDAVSVRELLDKLGLWADKKVVEFYARDGEDLGLPRSEIDSGTAFLAVGIDGVPLPHIRGGPARLIVRGHWGARSLKWIYQLHQVDEEEEWVASDHPTHAVRPFAFCSTVADGARVGRTLELGGGAYAGRHPVESVSIEVDDEAPVVARFVEPPTRFRMARWQATVGLEPGLRTLRIRCRDSLDRASVTLRDNRLQGWDQDHVLRLQVA